MTGPGGKQKPVMVSRTPVGIYRAHRNSLEGECHEPDDEKPLPGFRGRMLGGPVEQPGGMALRMTRDRRGPGGPHRPGVDPGLSLSPAGVGRALGSAVPVAHGPVVISGPGPPLQPGPHPGATFRGFSPDGPQRRYGPATGLPHSPAGSVLQCHLGVCCGLVVKLGGDA